jgi:predicted O-methyltransferase YrrM
MYSSFQLAKKYAHYFVTAYNGKGHGMHSPFVYNFIINVLNDKKQYDCYLPIEKRRQQLKKDTTVIEVEDFGAGSSVIKTKERMVKNIAASSLKPKKFAQLLFRIAKYYQPKTVLELGTSFGITTSYLASAGAKVFTCEGSPAIANIAMRTFEQLHVKNTQLTEGDFAKTLPLLLQQLKTVDLAFIDGNHRKAPTLDYFTQLLSHINSSSILIFDDIHWSADMEAAWEEIKAHPAVTLSIDLFFIGLVFFSPDFKVKQHFTIRF